ncbi:universal stress protein [Nocardioides endophyticus]|uniref:Universal stress protein n=1 Tax=Nocardioides endophyticus TaxID=1353775 RepID=A0ABP8Z1S4_9ACTN
METSLVPPATIVVGVDGSTDSKRAVWWAANEAAARHSTLLLIHALDGSVSRQSPNLPEPGPRAASTVPSADEVLAEEAQHATTGHPSLVVRTRVVSGDPRQVLLDLAETAQLLVVGSHGRGPIRRRMLGSVSAELAERASCPVIVMRPYPPGPRRRGVLVGVDADSRSLPVLGFAFREAAAFRLPLTVMTFDSRTAARAMPCSTGAGGEPPFVESLDALRALHPEVQVNVHSAASHRGGPERALSVEAATMDVLVIGRDDTSGHSHTTAGGVSDYLVHHASTIVVVVPTGPDRAEHRAPSARQLAT